ncbi:Uma2 family endonuclease [Streptomyces gilvosporeus]|uniref:Putative restriction endonuclease domain-containing protein n=1 Tax=Streptomyces gilvosporeus TaxID=553510 RepID=A0A1V0TVQ0_9ACTN|nr:hypothetical protein B1H19_25005 [Streptomyces gilvosporeus]
MDVHELFPDWPRPPYEGFTAEARGGPDTDRYAASDVVLALETVSPDSEERDRRRKPRLYADAGIPYFWRVEADQEYRPVVYTYVLDPAGGAYVPTGVHRDRLALSVPYDIDIDLTGIDEL